MSESSSDITSDALSARYRAAESLLPYRLKTLIDSPQVQPNWIQGIEAFWYRNDSRAGTEYVYVDAAEATKRPAFDHHRAAAALGAALGAQLGPTDLPLSSVDIGADSLRADVGDVRIELDLGSYSVTKQQNAFPEVRSPDGRWYVSVREHNLHLRDARTGDTRQLTFDGQEAFSYATPPDVTANRVAQENLGLSLAPHVVWSPDSSKFVSSRADQRDLELMHLVRSTPLDGGRPTAINYRYAMIGDEFLATADFFVFDAETGSATQADCPPIPSEYLSIIARDHAWWSADSDRVYLLCSERGGRLARLLEIDADSGEVATLVEEVSETHGLYGPEWYDRNVVVLDTGDILWWSERSGWGHLYLYGTDGSTTQLTSGEWLVRKIVGVDQVSRQVVFTAAGRESGADPYVQGLYQVSLLGGQVERLTQDELDHDARPSPSGKFFVDVMSLVDVPATSVLRSSTGAVVLEVEQADASALYATGFSPAERVMVKAIDGVTELSCAIYKPHDFNPSLSYPVLDEIYPGPQISAAPIRFPLSGGVYTAEDYGASFAALGFIVVVVDGRGTALRDRAFQDRARVAGNDEFIADHVSAIRQLAETRPWMDVERVGVYGHSGGGYASTRSVLVAPDFYKVAVSSAGSHDDRMYHAWWGERFFGFLDEFDYDSRANASMVEHLAGKLLLIHGEMDDNVTPHLTMRLMDALMRANKDFDQLIVPNADHSMVHHREYWLRRRWDYFVEHLMGATPPPYRIASHPVSPDEAASLIRTP